MNDQLLRTSLLDLWKALGATADQVLLGGGYGLYLKQLHLAHAGDRTLIQPEVWPSPRATQDMDLLLLTEIVANATAMHMIRGALDQLDYHAVQGSEYLQFTRRTLQSHVVKIDLLTSQLDVLRATPAIKSDQRRARPAARIRARLHAHPTDGALALQELPLTLQVTGRLSTGESVTSAIKIPHAFNYLLMKLTAYRDRRRDASKDMGRYHSLDIFRIIAMLTQEEFQHVQREIRRFADNPQVLSCAYLVTSAFDTATAEGVLAMREHQLWHNEADIPMFIGAIRELFTAP